MEISKATPSFTTRVIGTPNGGLSVRTIDLDSDSDMDFLVAAFDGDVILWYENNGSQTFTEQTIASVLMGQERLWPVDGL